MNKIIVILAAVALLSGSAVAGGCGAGAPKGGTCATNAAGSLGNGGIGGGHKR